MKSSSESMTVKQFFAQFPDDESCLQHLFNIRFGQRHVCPRCQQKTKWYRIKAERAYSCQKCGNHLHPTVGTPFESSRTSLQSWFYAIYLFTTSRHGVPAKELQRQLGVTYKTAWRMGHEIRKHMADVDGDGPLGGDVEIDETMVGGRTTGGKRGRGAPNKTVVFGMLQRDGEVMAQVVSDVKRRTLEPIITQNVKEGATVHTDELLTYAALAKAGYNHQTVNHSAGEYVNGAAHVNGMENFWKHLKGAIKSTHIHVSGKHLQKYVKEFEFRFNGRGNPSAMFPELVSTFARPLTTKAA